MTNSASQAQPTSQPTQPPQVTLTVLEATSPTPTATRASSVRTAAVVTSQPTATPQLYTVQENDTLLDIAIEFDIDLNTLLAANPEIDPRALQIGQQLVIPDDSTPEAATDFRPTPPPLVMTAPTCYGTATNSVVCLGEIENDQDSPVENVEVTIELLDAAGGTLGEQATTLEQIIIPNGQTAPYRVLFPGVDENRVQEVVATITGGELSTTTIDRFVALMIRDETHQIIGARYSVSAMVINSTEKPASPPRAVITLYNNEEQVVGYRVWEAAAPLMPGDSIELDVTILPVSGIAPTNLSHTLYLEAPVLTP